MLFASRQSVVAALLELLPHARSTSQGGTSLEVNLGGADPPNVRESRRIEGTRFRSRSTGGSGAPQVSAFLDGVQRSEICLWIGTTPVLLGRVGAVIRARVSRKLVTWGSGPMLHEALYAPPHVAGLERAPIPVIVVDPEDETVRDHPYLAVRDAYRRVQSQRERIEHALADAFLAQSGETLYIDGSLPNSESVLKSISVIAVVKSHQTLYVAGEDLSTVLGLLERERSSVFEIVTRRRAPVASWYLRLRDATRRDPFFGLVRIEVPRIRLDHDISAAADECSRAVLAERSPVSLPDGRWDTMAYGIRNCEDYLGAALPGAR